MQNGLQEPAAVVFEPAQARFAASVYQTHGATEIPDAELKSIPTAEVRLWAGTWPGVMAAKRPSPGATRVDPAAEAASSPRCGAVDANQARLRTAGSTAAPGEQWS
jgi:hypothetical protein